VEIRPQPAATMATTAEKTTIVIAKTSPSPKRYSTAITIALVLHIDVFHGPCQRFSIVLRRGSDVWVTVHHSANSFCDTLILLASSFTQEAARRRLTLADPSGFRKLWLLTTGLGILFVGRTTDCVAATGRAGRLHRQQPGQSFFYISPAHMQCISWRRRRTSLRFLPQIWSEKNFARLARKSLLHCISMDALWVFCSRFSTWENNSKQRRKNLTFQKIGDGLDDARDLSLRQSGYMGSRSTSCAARSECGKSPGLWPTDA